MFVYLLKDAWTVSKLSKHPFEMESNSNWGFLKHEISAILSD